MKFFYNTKDVVAGYYTENRIKNIRLYSATEELIKKWETQGSLYPLVPVNSNGFCDLEDFKDIKTAREALLYSLNMSAYDSIYDL